MFLLYCFVIRHLETWIFFLLGKGELTENWNSNLLGCRSTHTTNLLLPVALMHMPVWLRILPCSLWPPSAVGTQAHSDLSTALTKIRFPIFSQFPEERKALGPCTRTDAQINIFFFTLDCALFSQPRVSCIVWRWGGSLYCEPWTGEAGRGKPILAMEPVGPG